MTHPPHILLINPWIHDFAAYDFWAKPLGLLTIAGLLRDHGCRVSYIDCLDRFHPHASPGDPLARYGRGPYLKTKISKPPQLQDIPRNYSRYGIKPEWFRHDLEQLPEPDLVLVTSLMTYWYPGVVEAISIIREIFPHAPIVLGGIYATLCPDHARKQSGADQIVAGPVESSLFDLLKSYTGQSLKPTFDSQDLDTYPYPALDLQHKINYAPILTSRGCPFRCAYCASHILEPRRMQRSPESVVEEINFWNNKYDVRNFVLYDDAFLMNAGNHSIPILEKIIKTDFKIHFHTPNAVHIRGITSETATLMHRAGFKTLRIGLETTEFEQRQDIDRKVTAREFEQAVGHLKKAGFEKKQVGAYLLCGLPGQHITEVESSIKIVTQAGITPILAHYTPIPQTKLWPTAVNASRYDLESDPIYTNNAIFPCRKDGFSWPELSRLKELARK